MRGSVELTLSQDAQDALKHVGRLQRGLITQAIRDAIVAPYLSNVEVLQSDSDYARGWTSAEGAPPSRDSLRPAVWRVRVGDYNATVRVSRTGEPGRFVGSVTNIEATAKSSATLGERARAGA